MQPPLSPNKKKRTYPFWAPRFWHSMRTRDWYRLMRNNRFRIHPMRWGLAGTVSSLACFNSIMARVTDYRYGKRIEAASLPDDPIFVVGHWRSGTTYLHELLSCDERLTTPTTFQCFAANHFLITESWMPKIIWFLMPSRRPMDNMTSDWNSPQEDEFAMCALGAPSPYLRIAFPNEPRHYFDYLDLQSLPSAQLDAWQARLRHFMKCLTLVTDRRLVLKSPTHTARIGLLAQMFPRAKFIHIVRHPLAVFPSTINLWQVLDEAQGLQIPHHRQLQSYVLDCFERMYDAFESQRETLSPDRIYDVKYEDLVQDPVGTLERSYAALDLGDFQKVQPALRQMTEKKRSYRTNEYSLPDEVRAEVMQRWQKFATEYGYG